MLLQVAKVKHAQEDNANGAIQLEEAVTSGKAGGLSCKAEKLIRAEIVKVRKLREPTMIRAVFHDAVDADNLLVKNLKTGVWEPLPSDGAHYGGVDGCLYSPLDKGDKGKPEPSHNQNIGGNLAQLGTLCKKLCQKSALKSTPLCASQKDCPVDLAVLAAITAIENAGGPRIPMTWGRKKGPCQGMIVTPTKRSKNHDPENYDKKPALRFAPSLTGIDDAEDFRKTFQNLGFNAEEQAALMGAHTFGKLSVCAGGLNGIEKGNFCRVPKLIDPPLNTSMYTPDSNPKGKCVPKVGVVSNCWKCGGGTAKEGSKTFAISGGGGCAPKFSHGDGKGYGTGFGDGGFWDRTPQTFDNDYFKLFQNEKYSGKDNCCGSVKNGHCHRRNRPARILSRDKDGKATKKGKIKGGICSLNWCRSDRKDKTHMKSVKTWHETSHDFVKKGARHGVTKRMIRLAGDWALLSREDTRAAVQKFADSNEAFHETFVKAFGKVINKGYEHDNSLTTCVTPQN